MYTPTTEETVLAGELGTSFSIANLHNFLEIWELCMSCVLGCIKQYLATTPSLTYELGAQKLRTPYIAHSPTFNMAWVVIMCFQLHIAFTSISPNWVGYTFRIDKILQKKFQR